jgi:hypothetical protein
MFRVSLRSSTVALPYILLAGCAASEVEPKQTSSDVAQVEEYLKKNHPGKTWEAGPTRIDTEEVRAAYGERRFYYVFSTPPVPTPSRPSPSMSRATPAPSRR